ncbi:phage tail protein [Photobacterium phosphoreum]|uniref:phage tail-collar fiber domain-containing protein n=1 Tax=Photobacterium phosphoreum TaxID=659 RepID=UPI000D184D2A|nr:phage tail protein [Photobacterium phosphoreum]PSU35407.1 hypothetical protein CTM85_17090 [Photobacterium phosphoreum]
MAQTVIPFSFETYLQKKLASGDPVTLNKIVLANIPNLDLTQPIPRDTGLPTHDQIVHEQVIDQVGKINTNALAYSIVMDTTMGDFTFNAMYLIDKDDRNSIGMIVWKLPETKTATNEQSGTTGNSLVKSMLMEYDGAAIAAAITVTAATWQIDYSARLIGIDDDVRLQALDVYGHDAFIDDGFVVTKATNTDQYFVGAGVGYIGGLRAVLAQNQTLAINTKPTSIWVSVSRQGTVLGAWSNSIELKVSVTALNDTVIDGVYNYVAKIAEIGADGSIIDVRNPPHPDYLLANGFIGKVFDSFDQTPQKYFVRADGAELLRTHYRKLWQWANDNNLTISQAIKDTDPFSQAAYYGAGDDLTTFTVPHLHQGQVLRGASTLGSFLETKMDMIRNISGSIRAGDDDLSTLLSIQVNDGNAFSQVTDNNRKYPDLNGAIPGFRFAGSYVKFDASKAVPTGPENSMKNTNIYKDIYAGE